MDAKERLAFAVAGFGQNLVYNWVALYLLAFLYAGAGLSTRGIAILTGILSGAKVVDAISDLMVGMVIDRTRTRWGTFRPYPVLAAGPIALLTIVLFRIPGGSEAVQLTVIGATYVAWSLIYTTSDVPYWSLTTVITTDDRSRSRLIGYARTAGMLALALATLGGPILAVALSGGAKDPTSQGYGRAAMIVAVIGCVLFTLASFATREKVAHPGAPLSIGAALRQFLGNRPLSLVLLTSVLCFGQVIIQVGGAVIATVVFGDVRVFTVLGAALISGMILATLTTPLLFRWITRRALLIRVLGALAAAYVLLYAVGHGSVPIVAAVIFGQGLLLGAYVVTQTMLIGDTVDYAEAMSGRRVDGASFAGLTFVTKLGGALATAAFGLAVAAVGYHKGDPVTPAMRDGLWLTITLVPAASCLLGILPMLRYAVPERDLPALLAQRRAAGAVVAAPQSET